MSDTPVAHLNLKTAAPSEVSPDGEDWVVVTLKNGVTRKMQVKDLFDSDMPKEGTRGFKGVGLSYALVNNDLGYTVQPTNAAGAALELGSVTVDGVVTIAAPNSHSMTITHATGMADQNGNIMLSYSIPAAGVAVVGFAHGGCSIVNANLTGDKVVNDLDIDGLATMGNHDMTDPEALMNLAQTRGNFSERGSQYFTMPNVFSREKLGATFVANHVVSANGDSWNPVRIYGSATATAGDWAKLKYPSTFFGPTNPNYVTSGRRSFVADYMFSMHTGANEGERSMAIGTLYGNDPLDNATLFGNDGSNNRYGYALVLANSGGSASRYTAKLVASQSGDVVEHDSSTEYYSSNNIHLFRLVLTETYVAANTVRVDCSLYIISEHGTTSNQAILQFTRSVTVNTSNVAVSIGRHCYLMRNESAIGTSGFNVNPRASYKEVLGINNQQ